MLQLHANIRAIFIGSVGSIFLAGCQNTVILHYRQPANCYLFDSNPTGSPHTTTSAGSGMFLFYDIVSIENKASGAKDFNFDPAKLFANGDSKGNTVPGTPGASVTYLLTGNAVPKLVPKGTTSGSLGRVVINLPSDDPTALKTAQMNLLYKSASGESVLLARDPGPAPKFLDPCTPANVNALP